MKIIDISISLLKMYDRNNKKHPEEQVEKIKKSIQEFGFRQPILIDSKMSVIAGHGRILAAKDLGMDKVPCIVIDDLTPEQVMAFRIADNKTAISEWDFDNLKLELNELASFNYDLAFTGFDREEIDSITGVERLPDKLTADGELFTKPFMTITFESIEDMQRCIEQVKVVLKGTKSNLSVSTK